VGPVGENCQLMDVARRIFPSSFVCFIPGSGGGDGGDGGGGGSAASTVAIHRRRKGKRRRWEIYGRTCDSRVCLHHSC